MSQIAYSVKNWNKNRLLSIVIFHSIITEIVLRENLLLFKPVELCENLTESYFPSMHAGKIISSGPHKITSSGLL